jgi:hypothetical protein
MDSVRRVARALCSAFPGRAAIILLVGGLGGASVGDAAQRSEGVAFVGFLASLAGAALATTLGVRLRDAVLPIAEALGAAGGALLAIAFGLGVTDQKYMKEPSTGQLLMVVLSVTIALVWARLQVSREARERQLELDQRLRRIEEGQESILRQLRAVRSATARADASTPRLWPGGRARLRRLVFGRE